MIKGFEVHFTAKEKKQIIDNIANVLDAGMIIDHTYHGKLREKLMSLTSKDICDFSSSNTMATEVLYRSLNNKKIIFQGNMFVSPIFSSRRAGMDVEFVDIELDTLGIDSEKLVEKDLKDKIVCMMHTGGVVSKDSEKIREICDKNSALLVEDCAQSFGSTKFGEHCGTHGHYAIFSFAATKIFTSVAGGAILHNDSKIHDLIVGYTNCGKLVPYGEQTCDLEGFSARLTEIQSAMLNGIDLDQRLKVRQNAANIYFEHLRDLEGKAFRKIYFSEENNNYRLFILLNKGHNFEDFSSYAEKEGWYFSPPVFRELPYKTPVLKNHFMDVSLPATEDFCEHHVCLPLHEGLNSKDATFVAKSARKYFQSL